MPVAPAMPIGLEVKPVDWGLKDPLDQAAKAQNLTTQAQLAQQRAAQSAQTLQTGDLEIQQKQRDLQDQQIIADAYRSMAQPQQPAPSAAGTGSALVPGTIGVTQGMVGGAPQTSAAPSIDPGSILVRALADSRGLSGKAASGLLNGAMEYRAKTAIAAKDNADAASAAAAAAQKRSEAVFGATAGLLQLPEEQRAEAFPQVRQRMITEGHIDPSEVPEDYAAWGGTKKLLPTHLAFGTQMGIDAENKAKADEASAKFDLAQKKAIGPSLITEAQNKATTSTPNAGGLIPKEQQEADDRAAALAQKTANDAAERKQNDKRISQTQQEVNLKQKQFDATFGQGLDANGRPLSPEDRKNAALSDPTAVAQAAYQIPPPSSARTTALGKAQWDKILAIDPSYDGTKFAERNKIAQDYSASGKTGKAITSADTALAHLDTVSQAGKALDNGDFKALNQIANSVGAQIGSSKQNTYDTIIAMVAPEISKAVIGEAGGEGERMGMASNFSSKLSTPVREQAIGAAAGLLGARVHKQAQAYESDMGKPLARKLSPESQAVLDRYTGGAGAAGGTVTVKDPTGGIHTFKNQADADGFKKAANLP